MKISGLPKTERSEPAWPFTSKQTFKYSGLKMRKPDMYLLYLFIHFSTNIIYINLRIAYNNFFFACEVLAFVYTNSKPISISINLLKTKRRLLYLKTQFVPRSKHFSSWL